jgi:DNA-directed RNA polymerase subunit omega
MVGCIQCAPLIFGGKLLNIQLLEAAKSRVGSMPVLINMVSKRVKQLNAGFRPYIKPSGPDEDKLDIALKEISEGKIIAEMDFSVSTEAEKV